MTTITSLDLCTVPLTEEGVERYKISDSVSNHLTSLFNYSDDLNCSVGRIFNKIKVPVSWIAVNAANYIKATMEFNNPSGSTLQIYGWIDSVDPISDTDGYAAVEVKWHFDYWEMYKSSMTFGYGQVVKRPIAAGVTYPDTIPHQNLPYRYKTTKTKIDIITPVPDGNNGETWWVIYVYNHVDAQNHKTDIVYGTFPVLRGHIGTRVRWNPDPVNPWIGAEFMSLADVLNGGLTEELGINPENIVGVWLSPYPPNIAGSFTSLIYQSPYYYAIGILDSNWIYTDTSGADPNDPIIIAYERQYPANSQYTFAGTEITPSEFTGYVVQSFGGEIVGELPYGITVKYIQERFVLTPTDCYLSIRFIPKGKTVVDVTMTRSMGLEITIPLPTLPVNENAWDSYRYSGQRDYDIDARVIQSNTNAWRSSAGGGASGAMMGAFGPAGAGIGIVGGVAGGLISYGVEMLYTNDEEQRILDRKVANQPSSILIAGDGDDIIFNGQVPCLVSVEMDSYSAGVNAANIAANGYSVDEIRSSCATLLSTESPTGFHQIKNLIITGSVPKEAKDYVKKKFASGVKLL